MALKPEEKKQIIAEYATHEGDTGSPRFRWLCSQLVSKS